MYMYMYMCMCVQAVEGEWDRSEVLRWGIEGIAETISRH